MILPPTIKERMSSFIENNNFQIVYEQANTINRIANAVIPAPSFELPFPPPIKAKDLIARKKNGAIPSRSPNAFLIYRRVFVQLLKAHNYAFKMTDVSSMASARWKDEPEHVKREYLVIAGEAKTMLTTTRHKTLSFSQRKWRDHSNKNSNTRTQKAKTSPTPQSPRKKQQTSQSSTQEPKQQPRHQFQPLNISQPIFDNVEDHSPSFADTMEEVSNLFDDIILSQSSVSDFPVYPDSEYLPFTNADYDIFNQPSYPMTNNYWAPNELFIFDINKNHLN
uniref:MATA-HMG n=1 Tax=Rhizophagus irregularis TaxID=588596 RepID=A0A1B1EW73_9GLOM|nr:MATA-HMG [Rhizophagus irregularis]